MMVFAVAAHTDERRPLPQPAGGGSPTCCGGNTMPWGRLDDTLYDHPKLDRLGKDRLAAIGLWTICISWCNRYLTDGIVPAERILRLGGTRKLADSLVSVGLLDKTSDGYAVHDFLMYNDSREEVENERKDARERMKVVRANRRGTPPTGSVPPSRPVLSRPVPTTPDPLRIVDEREMTDDQRAARVTARLSKLTGVQ